MDKKSSSKSQNSGKNGGGKSFSKPAKKEVNKTSVPTSSRHGTTTSADGPLRRLTMKPRPILTVPALTARRLTMRPVPSGQLKPAGVPAPVRAAKQHAVHSLEAALYTPLPRPRVQRPLGPLHAPPMRLTPRFMWSTESSRQRRRINDMNGTESAPAKPLGEAAPVVVNKLKIGGSQKSEKLKNRKENATATDASSQIKEELEAQKETTTVADDGSQNSEELQTQNEKETAVDNGPNSAEVEDRPEMSDSDKAIHASYMQFVDALIKEKKDEFARSRSLNVSLGEATQTTEDVKVHPGIETSVVIENNHASSESEKDKTDSQALDRDDEAQKLYETTLALGDCLSFQAEYSLISDCSLISDDDDKTVAANPDDQGCGDDMAEMRKENVTPSSSSMDNQLMPPPSALKGDLDMSRPYHAGRFSDDSNSPQMFYTPQGKYSSTAADESETPVTALGTKFRQLDLNNV